MKNVIIPVDFSEASLNAARYSANLLAGQPDTNVILYNMFTKLTEADTTREYLDSLKDEFIGNGLSRVEVVKEAGEDLIDSIERLAFQKAATLIILGISGHAPAALSTKGSTSLRIAERNVCPVLIIPPSAKFNGISNIAFTSDFKNLEATPVLFIKSVLSLFKANLHIINVNSDHYISINEDYAAAEEQIKKMFEEYEPDFYFMHWNNVHEAVNQFAIDKDIDLILITPKHHTLINRVVSSGHAKELVYHSTVPVLAIHQ
ncbi:MAG: universal stress protein [Sphingobacteriales bacterium]|nr:universal stress protein [Sphingobacteriales bacterium]